MSHRVLHDYKRHKVTEMARATMKGPSVLLNHQRGGGRPQGAISDESPSGTPAFGRYELAGLVRLGRQERLLTYE